MEKTLDLDSTSLLIDFNSPVSKRPLDLPLIPIPSPPGQLSVSPVNSNPFDVVERQIAPLDPFECAFKDATAIDEGVEENVESAGTSSVCSFLHDSKFKSSPSSVSIPETAKVPLKNFEGTFQSDVRDSNKTDGKSVQNISAKNSSKCKSASKSVIVSEADSQSQISADLSTEEGLKAVIAKRVNKCIQSVLNNTLKSKFSQSSENLKSFKSESNITTTFNRRSLSFVMDSKNNANSGRLNKSCAGCNLSGDLFLESKPDFPDSTVNSFNISQSSPSQKEFNGKDSIFAPPESELVFNEANKLARTFSRIAESFCQDSEDSDNENDLLSCKPRWLYAESSEDEEEKLLKDPALNIRVSLTPSNPSRPDSKTLSAFKTRRSLDLPQIKSMQEKAEGENETKRPPSAGSKFEEIYPPNLSAVPVSVDLETLNIKLKKSTCGETKRGPMRAVMPVQSMTKDFLQLEVKAPVILETSPIRKHNAEQIMVTPKRKESRLIPVASSTPNKPSPLLPCTGNPANKRKSLGDDVKHKSRTSELGLGARMRSNSAKSINSSIPTPLGLKKAATVKPPFKPQSTSSLPVTVNSQVGQSYKSPKTGLNPRALSEVKSKASPKSGRIKDAVSALSSLVTGKSKKPVSQDKENKVPIK